MKNLRHTMRAEIVKDSEPARNNYIIDIQNSHWQINTNEWQQKWKFPWLLMRMANEKKAVHSYNTCLLPSGKDNAIVYLSSHRLPNQFLSAKPSNVLAIYVFNLKKSDICVDKSRGHTERWRSTTITLGSPRHNAVGSAECVLGASKGATVEPLAGIKEDIT